jgi:hypothetical protein
MQMSWDWLQGDRFKEIADFTYSPENKLPDDYDNLLNTFDLTLLNVCNIIYTHMGYVKQLFDVIRELDKKFIIITHSCDCSVESYGIRRPDGTRKTQNIYVFTIPNNVIKWYSKNVNVVDSRVESIPTGIENNRWFERVHKKEKMLEICKQPRKIRNIVYMNHNISTNPDERLLLYNLYRKKEWVTARNGKNGKDFDQYIDDIYNHKFVFCPGGNGLDSHRKWECLYVGTIPIEKRNLDNQFYQDLPICFVDRWEDITLEFLMTEFVRIKAGTWNMDKLNFEYWKNKIQSCK